MNQATIPFKILQKFLKNNDKNFTQAKIAERLGVDSHTVKKWSAGTLKVGSGNAENIFFQLFDEDSPSNATSFLIHLKNLGYNIPENLFSSLESNDNIFISFLGDFLAGNVKRPHQIVPIGEPITSKAKKIGLINYMDNDVDYYYQTVYRVDNNTPIFQVGNSFEYTKEFFKKLDNAQRVLISAPGGQGKSLFLRKLEEKAVESSHYKDVIRIDLTDLFSLSDNDLIQFDIQNTKHILCHLNKIGKNIDILKSILIEKKRPSERVLLLLDGLNELSTSSDVKKINSVLNELEYISKNWSKTTIVLTTRPSKEVYNFSENYCLCSLSGTPQDKLDVFLSNNKDIDEEIKTLAAIPMYYNILNKVKDTKQFKTKYDLLFQIYMERYNQSSKDGNSFFAFFILAPFIAREIHDSNKNSISLPRAKEISQNINQMNIDMLIEVIQRECKMSLSFFELDINNACSILLHNGPIKYETINNSGPLVSNNGEYKIFHDDIRDFLLAFSAIMSLNVMRESLEVGQFKFVKDISVNLNLKDEPTDLIKSKLEIFSGEDISRVIAHQYAVLDNIRISPQAILYAHTLFLISDYLNLGVSAVEPTHDTLIAFTNRIIRIVKQGNFINCLRDANSLISDDQQIRCKIALLDILSKHCEYYRRNGKFIECIKLVEIAETVQPDNDAIKNQKGKLFLQMYQSHFKDSKDYILSDIGVNSYAELYNKGREILDVAAENDFNLSVNLIAMLCSAPAPFLFENKEIQVDFDFVRAFHLCRSLIFTDKHTNYTTKEISYAVRQAIGLLIKGFVKFNPDFEIYEGENPGANSVVLGNRNTLALDSNTINIAKCLLERVEGIYLPTINYYKGVIAYYDNDRLEAKRLFDMESDPLLKSIFLHYAFGVKFNLDELYANIKLKMDDMARNAIDVCHPIYWYCDAKNLELSFKADRKAFFEKIEEDLPEQWRNIVKQLTQ